MPVIAAFLGMIIKVFHSDHPPPHIHVQYGEFEASVEIHSGVIMKGKLPKRIQRILKEWIKLRHFELRRAWEIAQENKNPKRIQGL